MHRVLLLVLVMLLAACSSAEPNRAAPGGQAGASTTAPSAQDTAVDTAQDGAQLDVTETPAPPTAGVAPSAAGDPDGPQGTAPITSPSQPLPGAAGDPAAAPAPPPPDQGASVPPPAPPPPDDTPAADPPGDDQGPADAADETVVGEASDARGDAGLTSPDYADLAAVTVFGQAELATVVVTLAAPLPDALAEGEVVGVGVDFFSDAGDQESDYQLFALGNADGWRAFYSDANGSYDLPGEFRLDGDLLGFQLPWFNLGDLPSGSFSAFLDWSQPGLAINESAADGAPDDGLGSFQR